MRQRGWVSGHVGSLLLTQQKPNFQYVSCVKSRL